MNILNVSKMFVETIVIFAISLTSIQSRLFIEEGLQISNDLHSTGIGGQDTDTTNETISNSPFAKTSDKKENKSDGHLPDDVINSIEPNNDNAATFTLNIDNVDITEKEIDNGTALLLTPYIESGRFDEARIISEVKSDIFLGVKSYSGFLTVNKTYNSNLFFWYFPIENLPVSDNPWIIWLQGGPGATSMTGLFDEIGPFIVRPNLPLKRNPYSWLRNHSLIFIDNPVGAGYSFTDHMVGFARDMPTYSLHLKLAVLQLLQVFPELKTAPLFVAGESYGGKYAPALAMELHKAKENGSEVNLQGIITGNGFVEASVVTNILRAFLDFALISTEDVTRVQPLLDAFTDDVNNNRSVPAKEKWGVLLTVLLYLSGQSHAYNFLHDDFKSGQYKWLLDRSDVKRAIHVGDIEVSYVNYTTNFMLAGEFLTSARPLYEELLEHYKVLAYCGQLDQMLPCFLESEQYRKWIWSHTEEFHKAVRYPFTVMNRLAGYIKSGGNLTEAQIRGAGHMAAMDSPLTLQELVSTFTNSQPPYLYNQLSSKVQEYITRTIDDVVTKITKREH